MPEKNEDGEIGQPMTASLTAREECECWDHVGDNIWCPLHYSMNLEVPC